MKKAIPVILIALLVVLLSWVAWHFFGEQAFHWYLGFVAFLIIAWRVRSRMKMLPKRRV